MLEIAPGSVLGPYELIMRVGEGGMAEVWVGRAVAGPRKGRLIALKMILPDLAEDVAFQQMLRDEQRVASRALHANVCETFELREAGGVSFLAMEWVDGVSLSHLLELPSDGPSDAARRPPLAPRIAARIVADVCAGLHAAHELVSDDGATLGVVHRDVSPHNVLITRDGEIKVTDFGVAKAIGKSHRTLAGQLKGKLRYMSPEQLVDGANVDRRSDVFALGCLLHESTTGRQTFAGRHDPEVMRSILLNLFESPQSLIAGYPVALDDIVVRALAKDRDDRFPSADHMRWALERYLQKSGAPVTAHDVAELVHERCGAELDAQAERLRAVSATLR